MDTVLLTVTGDGGTIEVHADPTVPVARLVPVWAVRCSSEAPDDLVAVTGDVTTILDGSATLDALGVRPGTAVRLLTRDAALDILAGPSFPRPPGPPPSGPPDLAPRPAPRPAPSLRYDQPVPPEGGPPSLGVPAPPVARPGPLDQRRPPEGVPYPVAPPPPRPGEARPMPVETPLRPFETVRPVEAVRPVETVRPVEHPLRPLGADAPAQAAAAPPVWPQDAAATSWPPAPPVGMPPTLRPAALDPRSAPPGNREDESWLPDRVPGRRRWVRALRAGLSRHAAPAPQPGVFAKAAAPKAGERYRLALQETDHIHSLEMLIRSAPLRRCVVIAVVSPKGGAGKTTITALLGTLLAELRRDPVLGLDANPDFGNLRDKLAGPDATVTSTDDLAEWLRARPGATPAELASMLGMGPHGLRYLPTPTGSIERMVKAADFGLYRDLIARLRDYEGIILVDCGTGLLDPPVRAALSTADQILLVTDSSADTARLVVKAARYLPTDTPTWLVANKMPDKGAMVDLDQVVTAIPQLRGVTIVPEQRLAENIVTPTFDWSSAPESWREPVREVAARLANNWRSLR